MDVSVTASRKFLGLQAVLDLAVGPCFASAAAWTGFRSAPEERWVKKPGRTKRGHPVTPADGAVGKRNATNGHREGGKEGQRETGSEGGSEGGNLGIQVRASSLHRGGYSGRPSSLRRPPHAFCSPLLSPLR